MDSLVKRALFLQNRDLRKLPFWRISCIDILPCSMWVAYGCLKIYVKQLKWFSPFRSLRTFALSSIPSPMDSVYGLYATYAAATVNKEARVYIYGGVFRTSRSTTLSILMYHCVLLRIWRSALRLDQWLCLSIKLAQHAELDWTSIVSFIKCPSVKTFQNMSYRK